MKHFTLCFALVVFLTSCWNNQEVITSSSIDETKNNIATQERVLSDNSDTSRLAWSDTIQASESIRTTVINPESHPKFALLKKDQNLLATTLIKLQDPTYQNLIKERVSIVEWKEIWTPEIIKIDTEFHDAILNKWASNSWNTWVFVEILKKKNDLVSALRTTQEYRNYMQTHSGKLHEIDTKLQAYTTLETQALQAEITALTEEIYGTAR